MQPDISAGGASRVERGVTVEPVFIGGCDRSGTTLLGSLLGGMRGCVVVPEAQFVTECWHAVCRKAGWRTQELSELIGQHWRFRLWKMDLQGFESDAPGNSEAYADVIRRIVAAYVVRNGQDPSGLWVDHTPSSLRYAMTLNTLFPAAKFVHIVRDGRAVAASVLKLDWGPNTIVRATRWWMEKLSHGLAAEAALGPERVIRLRFEDLVRHPQAVLNNVCQFLGIAFDERALAAGQWATPEYSRDQHRLVGQSPVPGRADAWQDLLNSREIEIFEYLSGDLLGLLGYEPVFGPAARSVGAVELTRQEIVETIRREGINRFRRARRIRRHMT